MKSSEIEKHIETVVEPKMGEVSARGDRLLAEGVRALWEIALQLTELKKQSYPVRIHHSGGSTETLS